MADMKKKVISLVFLPLPGMGHLVSMVELAKNLLLHHNHDPNHQFSITILNIPPVEPSPWISSYISSVAHSGHGINFHELPKFDPTLATNRDNNPGRFRSALMDFQIPHVRSVIGDILVSSPIAAIVVDMLCIDMIDVADEFSIPCYLFFTSTATMLGIMLYTPTLDAILPADKDMEELQAEGVTISVPGFSSPMPPMAMPDPLLYRKDQKHMWFMHLCSRYLGVRGFIVNSYLELQPYGFKALEEGDYLPDYPTPLVYSAGPLLSLKLDTSAEDGEQHECIKWLDGQPPESVVFLCFGSMGSFSTNQAREIAIGLERSGHRFLWVLRSPPPEHLKGKSRRPTDAVLDEVLPEGFLESTKERGMVWPKFAPQTAILSHKALGGFVTHCGWNSAMESLWFGVPMLVWPLYAEQHFNAYEMVNEMGVAVELKIDRKAGNWVAAEEIERGVRCLMDNNSFEKGRKIRSKVMEMSEKGKGALREGGSSFLAMERLAEAFVSNISSQP